VRGKRFFLIQPSFYAVFSGALISIAVNLFTGFFYAQKPVDVTFVQYLTSVIISLIISSGSFLYLGIILEETRQRWALTHFLEEIDKNVRLKIRLLIPFVLGWTGLASAFIMISSWLSHV